MVRRLSIVSMLAAILAVALGQGVSRAEPVRLSLDQAKALPAAERLEEGRRLVPPESPIGAPAASTLPDERRLLERVDLRLEPGPAAPPAQPGRRLGHGDFVLSLPVGKWWRLHTSVRADYENLPRDGAWQVAGIPTVGIGLRFRPYGATGSIRRARAHA